MSDEMIDRIYEAAVVPELWPAVLGDLSGIAGARGGLVFSARRNVCWSASEPVHDLFAEYFGDRWFQRCTRRVCSMQAGKAQFFTEQDFWTEEQLAEDPMYRDLFRPHGVGWSTWTGLRMPTGDEIVVSIEREFGRGPIEREHVDQLNAMRPHLVRSAMIAGRLELQRALGAADALTRLGLPALLVDAQGRAVEANALIETVADHIRFGMGARFVLTDDKAHARLTTALAAFETAPMSASCSIPLRDEAGQPLALLHMMPIRRSAQDIFGLSYALLVITPMTGGRAPNADVLKGFFGLTDAEVRIAKGIARGETPEELATGGGVSIATVRTQLRKVLEKTGCKRQAEVAGLLARLSIAAD